MGSNSLKSFTQQPTEYRSLTHGRTTHVTNVVGFRNIKPGIAHLRRTWVTV